MKKIGIVILAILVALTTVVPMSLDVASAKTKKKAMAPGKHMVKYAKQYKGSRYVRGGKYLKNLKKKGDKNRVDCTGFVQGIYKRYTNVKLPGGSLKRMMRKAKKMGKKVGSGRKGLRKAKPGDILIFNPGSGRQHVGIYFGHKGKKHYILESNSAAGGVTVRKFRQSPRAIINMENVIKKKSKKYKAYVKKIKKANRKPIDKDQVTQSDEPMDAGKPEDEVPVETPDMIASEE